MESPVGKNWSGKGQDILKLPNGGGYYWARLAMQEIIGWFEKVTGNLILTGHVKDKMVNEGGTELSLKALDLQGKISNILSAKSDAIAYLYRDSENGNLMAIFRRVILGLLLEIISVQWVKLLNRQDQRMTF